MPCRFFKDAVCGLAVFLVPQCFCLCFCPVLAALVGEGSYWKGLAPGCWKAVAEPLPVRSLRETGGGGKIRRRREGRKDRRRRRMTDTRGGVKKTNGRLEDEEEEEETERREGNSFLQGQEEGKEKENNEEAKEEVENEGFKRKRQERKEEEEEEISVCPASLHKQKGVVLRNMFRLTSQNPPPEALYRQKTLGSQILVNSSSSYRSILNLQFLIHRF